MNKKHDTNKYGSNTFTIKENNLSLIIRLLHKAKICSRADLAIASGLKQATITNIINELINLELVKEVGHIEGRLKRRSIGITLNTDKYRILGVRLNRNEISVGLFDIENQLLFKETAPITSMTTPKEAMLKMIDMLKKLKNIANETNILAVGVALPGPFVARKGRIALMSGFPGWENIDIKEQLEKELSLPVFLEHDANCGALAEWICGETEHRDSMLIVLVDAGVGSGIIANNQLYNGFTGTAGEIGHTSIDFSGPKCECGNRGCLELYCSTSALRQQYREESLTHDSEIKDKSELEILLDVKNGDEFARKVFFKTATYLGIGLVNAINTLNPTVVVISGNIVVAGDFLLDVINSVLNKRLIKEIYENLEIKQSFFGVESAFYGSSALVLEEALKYPSKYFTGNTTK